MPVIREFKEFINRGNILDLAVGVIIGGAFGKITGSLVNDILMPPIGLVLGDMPFDKLAVTLKHAVGETPAVKINYGLFLQSVIDFLLIAFCVFMFLKIMHAARRKREAEDAAAAAVIPAPEPVPTREEVLLAEIRDLLKRQGERG
ncbi:MAG: large-conductance mechanosensitive channel protein MscL [Bacteroidota bacterium]